MENKGVNVFEITPKTISEELKRIFDWEVTPRKVGSELKKLKFTEKRQKSGKWYYKIKKEYLQELAKDYSLDWQTVCEELAGAENEAFEDVKEYEQAVLEKYGDRI